MNLLVIWSILLSTILVNGNVINHPNPEEMAGLFEGDIAGIVGAESNLFNSQIKFLLINMTQRSRLEEPIKYRRFSAATGPRELSHTYSIQQPHSVMIF